MSRFQEHDFVVIEQECQKGTCWQPNESIISRNGEQHMEDSLLDGLKQ